VNTCGYLRVFIASSLAFRAVLVVPSDLHNDWCDFIFVARHSTPKSGEELPPEFVPWIFVGVGSFLFLLAITMAICILIAGRCLSRRKGYSFAPVIACIESLFVPVGTILGVFTIIARSRESVLGLLPTATA
jgi:hypothetical protein